MPLLRLTVTDRPQQYELIAWDGSDEAAAWLTENFGEAATIGGEPGARTLTMWGSWVLEPGTGYAALKWGSFQWIPADQIGGYQLAAAPIEEWVRENLPDAPLPEPVEAPAGEDGGGGAGPGETADEPGPGETPPGDPGTADEPGPGETPPPDTTADEPGPGETGTGEQPGADEPGPGETTADEPGPGETGTDDGGGGTDTPPGEPA